MGGVRGWSEIPSCCQVETIGLCLRERWQGDGRDGVARPRQELVPDYRHPKRLLRPGRPLNAQSRQAP